MGVYDVTQLGKIAQTIKDLGRKRAIVVHGANGMDEATLSGDNIIYEINQNKPIKQYIINAKDYDLAVADNDVLKGEHLKKIKYSHKYIKWKRSIE